MVFNSKIILKTKVAPGASDSADPTGLITSEEKDLPPIRLHFNGTAVTMIGDEFGESPLKLGDTDIKVRQKAGTTATGTYNNSDGSITLSGVQFQITFPITIELPSFTLTTGSTGGIIGDFGNLTEQGAPLTPDKNLKFAGGFKIGLSFPLAEFIGAAVAVTLNGSVDRIPDPATCSGGGSGGLTFKEVVPKDGGGTEEVDLATNNTLNMGSVFVPQAGTDSPAPSDTKFFKIKTLRVKNNTSAAITGTLTNPSGYEVTPTAVNVAAGASQDFQIKIGFSPVTDYSETNVPLTRTVTGTLTFGSGTVNLSGVAKRAGSELTAVGTETSAPSTINLGVIPVHISGSGASSKLQCSSPIPTLARKITLQNTGIRPLNIQHINAPTDTDSDGAADPMCISYGQEFQRMALSVEGGASCQTIVVGGHTYLTDNCTIPVGNGKIHFKVVYLPKNASTVVTSGSQDTATMTIPSNDPVYATTPLTLNLQGAVSKDTSDLLSIRKKGASSKIRAGGSVNLNIPNNTDASLDQVLEILNSSSDRLQNVEITLSGPNAGNFQICPATSSTTVPPPLTGCANPNTDVVMEIPPMAGTDEGKAYFGVKFNKPLSGNGPFPAVLTIRYVPQSSPGVTNEFKVNLAGTVQFNPLVGNIKVEVEFISSFIVGTTIQLDPTDSIDFRDPQNASFKSGPLKLNIADPPPGGSVSDVTIEAPDLDSINLASMTAAQRRELIRVFTSRNSTCSASGTPCPLNGIPACTDPETISGSYQDGKCSYFYYALQMPAGQVGKYNQDNFEMTLPDLDIRLMNPYHAGLVYDPSFKTDTRLVGSLTTLLLNVKNIRLKDFGDNNVDLAPAFSSPQAVPASILNTISGVEPCPAGWDPKKDFSPGDPNFSPTPAFTCYISRSSPTSDAYMKGIPGNWVRPGEQSIILVMVVKFTNNLLAPDFLPPFLNNGTMWVAIQGRMKQCDDSWHCVGE